MIKCENSLMPLCEKHAKSRLENYAINVRTNHAHIVVAMETAVLKSLIAFKANSTRKMRENSVWHLNIRPGLKKEAEAIYG